MSLSWGYEGRRQSLTTRRRIVLEHKYSPIQPIETLDEWTNIDECIITAIFDLNNPQGSTVDEIYNRVDDLSSSLFDLHEVTARLNEGITKGWIRTLAPIFYRWDDPVIVRYTFHEHMDRFSANRSLVIYLIGLTGGTCGGRLKQFFQLRNDWIFSTPSGSTSIFQF